MISIEDPAFKAEQKDAFVKALRSKKHRQCYVDLSMKTGEVCALGVMCRVLNVPIFSIDDWQKAYAILEAKGVDIEWFWQKNDVEKLTFEQIADIVEPLPITDIVFNRPKALHFLTSHPDR